MKRKIKHGQDKELVYTLIAISVVAKRLAENLMREKP